MAGRRAPAKETLTRPNDQARREAATETLAPDGLLRGPELPEGEWNARTLIWWDTWRQSAQATRFVDTDWEALLESALLHTRLWNGEMSVAPELRLRVAKFGYTLEDRQKLGIKIDTEAAAASSQPPSQLDEARKRRLDKLAGDA